MAAQLRGVLDDDADAARELEVLEEERDAHERAIVRARDAAPTCPTRCRAAGAPVRVAFVGQRTYFEACAPAAPAGGVDPRFIDFRGGAETGPMLDELRALRARTPSWSSGPRSCPPARSPRVRAPVLGFLTEPLPRAGPRAAPQPGVQPRRAARASTAATSTASICFDPLRLGRGGRAAAGLALHAAAGRRPPLPRADAVAPPAAGRSSSGYSTMHREDDAAAAQARVRPPALRPRADGRGAARGARRPPTSGINVHGDALAASSFENRVLLHLAAGHLVALRAAGADASAWSPASTTSRSATATSSTCACTSSPRAGRLRPRARSAATTTAAQFRASQVWPRVIARPVRRPRARSAPSARSR